MRTFTSVLIFIIAALAIAFIGGSVAAFVASLFFGFGIVALKAGIAGGVATLLFAVPHIL